MARRNKTGQYEAYPTAEERLRQRRFDAVKQKLIEGGYCDGLSDKLIASMHAARKAAELVAYAYQANLMEQRDVDDVLRACLGHIGVQS